MKCNVIQDLIPLYVDDCCSEESGKMVREHLEECETCRQMHTIMSRKTCAPQIKAPQMKSRRVSDWKAGLLQSILLYVSFAIIVAGVILEGNTPQGAENGLWAVALLIPATANLLSLANWYFIRLYKNRKLFSLCSCLITLFMVVCGYGWVAWHYSASVVLTSPLILVGVVLSIVFVILSKLLSNAYGRLLGKE